MRKTTILVALLASVSWMPTAVAAEDASAFLGDWKVNMELQGRPNMATLTITENEDGTLAGIWKSRRGESPLVDVKVTEGQLSFTRNFSRQGQEVSIPSTAKIEDGKLAGIMTSPRGETEFQGARPGEDDMPETSEGQSGDAEAMLTQLDANADGVVTEDEAPEQMKQFFSMIDANADGGIDAEEMQTVIDFRQNQGGGGGGGRGGNRPPQNN